MSFNLVFDNLSKIREEADYIIRIVKEHEKVEEPASPSDYVEVASSPAGGGIRLYFVHPDDSQLLSEKLRLMGKAIEELRRLLLSNKTFLTKEDLMNYEPFREPVEKAKESFRQAYDAINAVVQGDPDDGSFLAFMNDFRQDIKHLERKVKEVEALSLDAPNVEDSYVERAVQSGLAKMEDEKTKVRQKIFLRSDPEGKDLLNDLLNAPSDKDLDRSVGRLMYLAGFDHEIYNHLSGNLDVLVFHASERVGILIETTMRQPLKGKVDQVIARRKEYDKFLEEVFGQNPRIYSLLVTTNENPQLSPEARVDAIQNEISIFTRRQIEELIANLRKGKLNRRKVVDIIRANIPT